MKQMMEMKREQGEDEHFSGGNNYHHNTLESI